MRSEKVFRAREQVANAYLLCRLAARTTRCLHFASISTQDAIEDALTRLSRKEEGPVHGIAVATRLRSGQHVTGASSDSNVA